ncbi:MAG: TetR/AcrR family transcriptional regulator [Sneathiella sp.]
MEKTQKNDRVEAILASAEHYIRRGGFNAVSFRDIASDVGIKSSSVHYHFPHKEDLGVAVIQRYEHRLLEALGDPSDPSESPAARIERLGNAYATSLQSDEAICLGCVLGAEISGLPDDVSRAVSVFFEKMIAWTTKALANAKGPTADATHIISTLQGAMVLAVTLKKPDHLNETVRRLVQTLKMN